MSETALATIRPETQLVEFQSERNQMIAFIKKAMKDEVDYGTIPGTGNKTLFKSGAEKLAKLFGLIADYELIKEVEDFEKGFFYYKYRCTISHFATGRKVGSCERSCNSYEKKYRYKTVAERFATEAEKKRAISKKQNKKYNSWDLVIEKSPAELIEDINTYQAMAQKRSLVACVTQTTSAGEIFGEEEHDVEGEQLKSKLMRQLHVTASERGFTHDDISRSAKERYKVASTSDLDENQLEAMIDRLMMEWDVVDKGEKPKRISDKKPAEKEEQPDIEEGEVMEALGIEEDEPIECRKCGKPASDDGDHAYFCSPECKESYWKEHGVKPKNDRKDFTFTNQQTKLL